MIWFWNSICEGVHVLLGNLSSKLAMSCAFINDSLINELVIVVFVWLTSFNCIINPCDCNLVILQELVHICCLLASRATSLINFRFAFLWLIQIVVLEEVDQITLPGFKEDISCELTYSELLDYFKHIKFLIQFLTAICIQPIFTLLFGSTAEAARVWEVLKTPDSLVLVREDSASLNLSLKFVCLVVINRVLRFLILVDKLLLLIIFLIKSSSSFLVFLLFAILGKLILGIKFFDDWVIFTKRLEVLNGVATKSEYECQITSKSLEGISQCFSRVTSCFLSLRLNELNWQWAVIRRHSCHVPCCWQEYIGHWVEYRVNSLWDSTKAGEIVDVTIFESYFGLLNGISNPVVCNRW